MKVNRSPLISPQELEKAVLFCPVGEEMKLEVLRRGGRIQVPVSIASRPVSSPAPEKKNVFPAR